MPPPKAQELLARDRKKRIVQAATGNECSDGLRRIGDECLLPSLDDRRSPRLLAFRSFLAECWSRKPSPPRQLLVGSLVDHIPDALEDETDFFVACDVVDVPKRAMCTLAVERNFPRPGRECYNEVFRARGPIGASPLAMGMRLATGPSGAGKGLSRQASSTTTANLAPFTSIMSRAAIAVAGTLRSSVKLKSIGNRVDGRAECRAPKSWKGDVILALTRSRIQTLDCIFHLRLRQIDADPYFEPGGPQHRADAHGVVF